MTNIVEGQLKEIAQLHEKNVELYQQIGRLEEALEEARESARRHRELEEEYRACSERQLRELERQKGEIGRLEKELEMSRENERRLGDSVRSMEKSVSWRLTRPLRYLRWIQLKGKKA